MLKRIFGSSEGQIAGFPWLQGESKILGTASLTGKFLCQGHNNGFSGLDANALRFVEAIQNGSREIHQGSDRSRTHTFDGDKLERWMLKLAFGLWETGGFGQDGNALGGLPPNRWKELLTGQDQLPEGWGAYFEIPKTPLTINENKLSIQPLSHEDRGVLAIKIGLCEVPIWFLMGMPENSDVLGTKKPPQIQFSNRRAACTLRLRWDQPSGAEGLHFQHLFGSL